MLFKSLEFKNSDNQKIKIIEIPVLEVHHYDWVIQAHLENLVSTLYHKPQEKAIFSFRDYLKRKMKWPGFKNIFGAESFKNNA